MLQHNCVSHSSGPPLTIVLWTYYQTKAAFCPSQSPTSSIKSIAASPIGNDARDRKIWLSTSKATFSSQNWLKNKLQLSHYSITFLALLLLTEVFFFVFTKYSIQTSRQPNLYKTIGFKYLSSPQAKAGGTRDLQLRTCAVLPLTRFQSTLLFSSFKNPLQAFHILKRT